MIEKRTTMASGGAADIVVDDAAAVTDSAGTFYVLLSCIYAVLWCINLTDESW